MNGFPTHGFCEGTVGFEILEGERDGQDLAGAKVAVAVKWPGAIHEGNGNMALFMDAPENVRDSVLAILTAEDPGLPWEILAATISEIHGPFFESINISDNETDSRVSVEGKLDVQMQSFTNPVSGEKHEAHMVLPGGFIFQDGKICTTTANMVDADGVEFDHAGNNAYYATVEWSSENRMEAGTAAGRF
jgi:hypothetical protein